MSMRFSKLAMRLSTWFSRLVMRALRDVLSELCSTTFMRIPTFVRSLEGLRFSSRVFFCVPRQSLRGSDVQHQCCPSERLVKPFIERVGSVDRQDDFAEALIDMVERPVFIVLVVHDVL